MKYRIGIGVGAFDVEPRSYADMVRSIRQLGFDSIWIPEVLTSSGPDVLVALGWAAQLDPKLKLGTTMLLPGRNPARLAKSLATLDVLSGGRLLVTFVPGLMQGPERAAIGVPPAERGPAIERTLPQLRRWWAGEEVEGISIAPHPLQQPLECWLGGIARAALVRCGRFGDGWLTAMCTPAEAAAGMQVINETAERTGRAIDPEHFGISIGYSHRPLDDGQLAAIATRTKGRDVDPSTLMPVGTSALRDRLQEFMQAGLSKFVVRPTPSERGWREELQELAEAVGDLQT
ncbi:LLM class flavin-dependent oxidoreductase [Jatrophihabitans sp. DSM 45814]